MHKQIHPDSEVLDRLRAGLLDDAPQEREDLERHLAACSQCRAYLDGWQQLAPGALGPELDSAGIARQLQQLRGQALASAGRPRPRNYQLLASAALLLIAVSVGLWTVTHQGDTPPMTAQVSEPVPDILEDLDFYLWLADQNGNEPAHDDEGANST